MDKLDQYIKEQKQIKASPWLEQRILNNIARRQHEDAQGLSRWQAMALVASVALVIAFGIALGTMYNSMESQPQALVVNDTYIEQLSIFLSDENE